MPPLTPPAFLITDAAILVDIGFAILRSDLKAVSAGSATPRYMICTMTRPPV